MAGRVSQEVVEAAVVADPDARVSQVVVEGQITAPGNLRVSQLVAEVQVVTAPAARVSQLVAEVHLTTSRRARVSQIVCEVLIIRIPFAMPPIYPELIGLGFDVKWTPTFFNMPTATTVTGADIDLGLSPWPLHDFQLIYNFLRDQFIAGTQEFREMFGFFLRLQGTLGRFLFRNPDDNSTTNEFICTTDGTSTIYSPMMRTFGVGDNSGKEPIGWIDRTKSINIYVDGVLLDTSAYSIIDQEGCNMQLKFGDTPDADLTVTGDYSYFYYCKFPDNANTFNKFMARVWALQQINIHSCRAGA